MSTQKRKADSELPRPSKQSTKIPSTVRRKVLGNFINAFGDEMPKACSHCRRSRLECRVHVKSGVCGNCHLSGSQKTCDVRVTQEEWSRLVSERARLLKEMKEALEAQQTAELARQDAERRRVESEKNRQAAIELETSLREQLRRIEVEAEDAIAVEEAQILALERFEAEQAARDVPESLALSPYTLSAEAGVPDDFWEPSPALPWVLS